MRIATCVLGGGGVLVATILALYAFDRSYTPPSQDKAGFTSPAYPAITPRGCAGTENTASAMSNSYTISHLITLTYA